MTDNKSPKTIATINFKCGVGKTTVTWCLADTLATYSNASVLMFDLDAQMSLTQAVGLNEDSGTLHPAFGSWYEKSLAGKRTIFDAIDQYTKPGAHFDFPVAYDFIYQTKTYANSPTKETSFYMRQIKQICDNASKNQGIRATFFDDAWVRERVGIKRAITGGGVRRKQKLPCPYRKLNPVGEQRRI